LHISKTLHHNDLTTKVVLTAWVTLIKPIFAKAVLEGCVSVILA